MALIPLDLIWTLSQGRRGRHGTGPERKISALHFHSVGSCRGRSGGKVLKLHGSVSPPWTPCRLCSIDAEIPKLDVAGAERLLSLGSDCAVALSLRSLPVKCVASSCLTAASRTRKLKRLPRIVSQCRCATQVRTPLSPPVSSYCFLNLAFLEGAHATPVRHRVVRAGCLCFPGFDLPTSQWRMITAQKVVN
jgi:hypothetical protein